MSYEENAKSNNAAGIPGTMEDRNTVSRRHIGNYDKLMDEFNQALLSQTELMYALSQRLQPVSHQVNPSDTAKPSDEKPASSPLHENIEEKLQMVYRNNRLLQGMLENLHI